ncbi:D-cysteine desulfhydrase family protein [Herbaspirillum sp. LeCh32-8]|nr:D-cysteine desulfhydrase family protein [Herbaspirillum sp. LeCh32-8]
MSHELGIELSVKRDDLSGLAAGGNKVRKLEYLVADAIKQGATVLITAGAIQSNHVLQTVAAARKSGLRAVAVLHGKAPEKPSGNFLFNTLLGAEIHYLDSDRFVEDVIGYMARCGDDLTKQGEKAYIVPVGGSNALGALGYVECARELAEQYRGAGQQPPEFLVTATGSVGTYAGLVAGCAYYWPETKIAGIVVTTNYFAQRENVVTLTNETAKLAGIPRTWTADDLNLKYDYVGPGYGIRSDAGNKAIDRLARAEGIFLDPTYTGKVFAGLIGEVEKGAIPKNSRVLFVHTGGSTALLAT